MLPTVISIVLLFALGLTVYLNNPKSRANRIYFSLIFIGCIWIAANYFSVYGQSTSIQIFASRLITPSSLAATALFYLFARNFPAARKYSKKDILYFFPTAMIAILSFTSLNFSTKIIHNKLIYTFGALYIPYIILMFLYVFASLITLVKRQRKSRGIQRNQISFVLMGLAFSALPAIFTGNILPAIGIQTFSNYSQYFALSFLFFTGYAIIRHKLFDIRSVVARSFTYLLVIATISVIYAITAFVIVGGTIFKTAQLTVGQQMFYALLAVLLAFTFQPIRRFFQRVTDKIFYRDKYDAQELINEVGHILTAEIRLNVLTRQVTDVISKQIRAKNVDIIVVNDKNIYYQARVLRADRSEMELKDLQELGKPLLVADDLSTGDRKDIMDKYGVRVSITLRTSEEFVGYLLLGEKLSGDIYNEQDLAVLRIIANELAVAVQNAKAYTEIQQFNKTLQAKVVAATHKLRKANDDLKELDQAKDEFISMASHQLRTPLTTAKGYVSMVLEGDFGKPTKPMLEPLTQALDSANRMAGLVSDLLNVSRMEAGRFFIDPIDVDLNIEVPAELTQLQTMADAKKVHLSYDKPPKPVPMMKLDLDKTRQVIMNLADNAIHYSAPPAGGGKVVVSLAQEGTEIVFKVVDNGIGVPAAQQKKMFQKFFRAANAQNARPDGTGLGLYLVKRVVEDQGGEIIFESVEGKGSTFGFRIPIHNKLKLSGKRDQSSEVAQLNNTQDSESVATKTKPEPEPATKTDAKSPAKPTATKATKK